MATGIQQGIVTVPADGSSNATVVFPMSYSVAPTVILQVIAQGTLTELTPQLVGAATLVGFTVVVTGGPNGSTAQVSWVAIEQFATSITPSSTITGYPAQAYYPFGLPGDPLGQWLQFDPTAGAYTYYLSTGITLGSIWFPNLTSAVALYDGSTYNQAVPPFYTTGVNGNECVPIPSGIVSVVMLSTTLTGAVMPVFMSSRLLTPQKTTPNSTGITGLSVTAPLTTTGGTSPQLGINVPLSVLNGGTGTSAPSLIAGNAQTGITGAWPDQTISFTPAPFLYYQGSVSTGRINFGTGQTGAGGTVTLTGIMPNSITCIVASVAGLSGYFVTVQASGTSCTFSSFQASGVPYGGIYFEYVALGS